MNYRQKYYEGVSKWVHSNDIVLYDENLKPESRNIRPGRVHLTDFIISDEEVKKANNIYYKFKDGYVGITLKSKGCIKPKRKMCKKRSSYLFNK